MSNDKITLHIGTIEQMGGRFVRAWRDAKAGGAPDQDNVTFGDIDSFLSAMSRKRRLRAVTELNFGA